MNKFHGIGLSSINRATAQTPQWRLKLSDVLIKQLLKSKHTRLQLTSKSLYMRMDRLNAPLLEFFYSNLQMPPTFQSWFSITQMHVWMCQTRLRSEGRDGKVMHASLLDHFTTDLEMKLDAAGISTVRQYEKHLHEFLSAHYGCVLAYDEGYETSDCLMASALWRNVFDLSPTVRAEQIAMLVEYIRAQMHHIHSLSTEQVMDGKVDLPVPVLSSSFKYTR